MIAGGSISVRNELRSITLAARVVGALLIIASLVFLVSAPTLRPTLEEVLRAEQARTSIDEIVGFVDSYVGRPGRGTGLIAGPGIGDPYTAIHTTLSNFDRIKDDITYVRELVAQFLHDPAQPHKCYQSIADINGSSKWEDQWRYLELTFTALGFAHESLKRKGLLHKRKEELSVSDLLRVFSSLPYMMGSAVDSISQRLKLFGPNEVCMVLVQAVRQENGQSVFKELSEYSGILNDEVIFSPIYNEFPGIKGEERADIDAFYSILRDLFTHIKTSDEIERLSDLPMDKFFENILVEYDRIRVVVERYAGQQLPYLNMSSVRIPIVWASVYYPLIVAIGMTIILVSSVVTAASDYELDKILPPFGLPGALMVSCPVVASILLAFANVRPPEDLFLTDIYGQNRDVRISDWVAKFLNIPGARHSLRQWRYFAFAEVVSFGALIICWWLLDRRRRRANTSV